jgi:chromosome segregation ATPase
MDFYAASNWASGWPQATILMNKHTDLYPGNESVNSETHSDNVSYTPTSENCISEKYDTLHEQYLTLKDQHDKLKKQFASLTETVQVLGDQSSHTTKIAQQAQDMKLDMVNQCAKLHEQLQLENNSKSELSIRNTNLQEQVKQANGMNSELNKQNTTLKEQLNGLKDAVEAMSLKCKAAEDKLLLQSQLHSDKLRLLEVSQNTLKDRCRTIAVTAEQHRMSNVSLEERHKSMSKDMNLLTVGHMEAIKNKDNDLKQLQSALSSRTDEVNHLQNLLYSKENDFSRIQALLCAKDKEITHLQSQVSTAAKDMYQTKNLLCSKEEEVSNLKSKVCSKEIDLVHLQSIILSKEKHIVCLQSQASTKDDEIQKLQSSFESMKTDLEQISYPLKAKGIEENSDFGVLHEKEREISSLKSKVASNISEIKLVRGKLDLLRSILKSHPIDPCLNSKTQNILRSSAEILALTHKTGSVESMRRCLGQVSEIIEDLNDQLGLQHRLSKAWLDRVGSI